jgi:5-methylcytosine-specific restriction enzyme A
VGKHPCLGRPGYRCPVLVTSGRCPACQTVYEGRRQRMLDQARGTSLERGYDAQWERVSKRHRAKYPLCGERAENAYAGWRGECHEQGRITPATCTDHIIPIKDRPDLRLEPRNHQSLCANCNRIKAIRFEGGFGRRVSA